MAAVFPWYCVVDDEPIEQGDLITRCQLVLQTSELIEASDEIPANLVNYYIVVLTQSCDLIQGKVDYVVVCPHWD